MDVSDKSIWYTMFIYFWYVFQNGGFPRHPWAYFGETAREIFSTSVSHGDSEGLYDWPQGTP